MTTAALLLAAHERLVAHYDIDRWHWRDDTPAFDICLGSILVQHTAWTNVEKALANLREAGIHSIEALAALSPDEMASLIRPSGTPVVKARRLQAFCDLVLGHGGLDALFDRSSDELRRVLLATHGIGPETADVICLYAARHPVVVHDAYTARLCRRLGTGPVANSYDAWRAWLDATLPRSHDYRARNHAAIVVHCKETCRVKPKCEACPLQTMCAWGRSVANAQSRRTAPTPGRVQDQMRSRAPVSYRLVDDCRDRNELIIMRLFMLHCVNAPGHSGLA